MNDFVAAALWLVAAVPSLILSVFASEVLLGAWKTRAIELGGDSPETWIIIPAHNEAAIIVETLNRLRPALSSRIRALVVADNCSDNTTALAKDQGFEVIERFDEDRRGKGYALAFARDHLSASPPDCVLVLDADCQSDPRSIIDLAKHCFAHQSPVQACYVFEPSASHSPKVQISNFAVWIKNVVRQRGAIRAGGGAILTGTGMAFPWRLFDTMPLATGSIVEDLALTVELTRAGHAPVFLEQSQIVSAAASEHATLEQRSRWEHGFLAVAVSHGIPLIWHGFVGRKWTVILLGLHLLVPPLALLMSISVFTASVLAVAGVMNGNVYPSAMLSAFLVAALAGVLLNWVLEGHTWLQPKALFLLPLYVVWKLPLYGRFLGGKRAEWIRTERD